MSFRKIVFAVDGTVYSQAAIEEGIKLASDLNATAVFLYVISPTHVIGSLDSGILPIDVEEIELEKGKKMMEGYVDKYGKIVSVEGVIKIGDPAKEILRYVEEWKADLIVIGRHGLESFSHLIFGGVVDEVCTKSRIPVFLVPYFDK